jgi:hypothetical protein
MQSLRRLVSTAVLSLVLAGAIASPGLAQRVTVDVSPLVAKGAGPLAAHIRATLPAQVRKAIAGKYHGPLTIRIRSVILHQFTGFGRIEPTDYMEGDLIIPGRPAKPILLAHPFDRSPTFLTPYGQALRINNLIEIFAYWVARYV